MKSRMQRKSLIALLLALTLFCAGVTYATFVARDDAAASNTFALGNVDTKIDEVLTQGNNQVRVENTGSVSSFVRVRLCVGGVAPADVRVTTNEVELDDDHVWIVLDSAALSVWGKNDKEDLSYSADDFYYYLEKLAPNTKTEPLLSKIYVGQNMGLDESHFTVNVYTESVVAKENYNTAALIANAF